MEKEQGQKQLNWTKPEAEMNVLILKSNVVTKDFRFYTCGCRLCEKKP